MPRTGLDEEPKQPLTTGNAPQRRDSISRRWHTLLAGLWSFGDQALVSMANFLLMVLLARQLPASEFGAFVLVYMALYLANNVQTSIVTRPHNLIGATLSGRDFSRYTAQAFGLEIILASLFAAFGIGAAIVAYQYSPPTAALFGATAVGVFAWQFQEFARQVQFTRGNASEVFRYDLIGYGGLIVLLFALSYLGALSGVSAMLALGLSSAAAAIYGFRRIGIRPGGSPVAVLQRNWDMARWILGDNLGQWLSGMLFPILTAAFAGTAATATYKLLQNVVAPLHVVFQALPSFAAPRAARAYHEGGGKSLAAFLVPMTLLVGLPVGAYLAGVSIFGDQVLRLMYGPAQAEHAELIWLFGGAYLAQYLIASESVALLAVGNARAIFAGRLVAIALTLTVGIWATSTYGVTGALAGMFVTNLGLVLVLAAVLSRGTSHDREHADLHVLVGARG